ncbi:NifB/NifX family molybdenum-iron cluster-binding protein [Methanohalobium sp.]|uniref:NifB/NifX family molybdenum-iron cluster-binding protein n=1 Tax=Methanohalobium sp. TaxID=2837493 RepID=UPI0025F58F0C|nr:NifB/NifX family molybdenum-iron cluster-binding protein [Methanohalobium sp.]
MIIGITAKGKNLDEPLDPRFGRSQYIVLADSESMEFEVFENSGNSTLGGAGIKAAQAIVDKDIDALITGNVGPNAFSVLSKANINVYTGAAGTIRKAIDDFKAGLLDESDVPTVKAHNGINRSYR